MEHLRSEAYKGDIPYGDGYYGCDRYAKKGVGNAALALGIVGTALGAASLWRKGGGLFGGCEEGIERGKFGCGAPCGGCFIPYNPEAEDLYLNNKTDCLGAKECEDVLTLTRQIGCIEAQMGQLGMCLQKEIYNGDFCVEKGSMNRDFCIERDMWKLALKEQKELCEVSKCLDKEIDKVAAKEQCDVLNLYRNIDAVAFKSFKEAAAGDAALSARICELEKNAAVDKATTPLRDHIFNEKLKLVALHAKFDLEKEMCRVVKGEVVLPSTPVVSGFAGINCCNSIGSTVTASE